VIFLIMSIISKTLELDSWVQFHMTFASLPAKAEYEFKQKAVCNVHVISSVFPPPLSARC